MLRNDSALNLLDIIAEADWIKIAYPDREILQCACGGRQVTEVRYGDRRDQQSLGVPVRERSQNNCVYDPEYCDR